MWITREKGGFLRLWTIKPYRGEFSWCTNEYAGASSYSLTLWEDKYYVKYKHLKWEDEPIEVELTEVMMSISEDVSQTSSVMKQEGTSGF